MRHSSCSMMLIWIKRLTVRWPLSFVMRDKPVYVQTAYMFRMGFMTLLLKSYRLQLKNSRWAMA